MFHTRMSLSAPPIQTRVYAHHISIAPKLQGFLISSLHIPVPSSSKPYLVIVIKTIITGGDEVEFTKTEHLHNSHF